MGGLHDQVTAILDRTPADEAVAVVLIDGDEEPRILADRLPDEPAGAKIVVLGMSPPPGSVPAGGVSSASEADAPAIPADPPTPDNPPRGRG